MNNRIPPLFIHSNTYSRACLSGRKEILKDSSWRGPPSRKYSLPLRVRDVIKNWNMRQMPWNIILIYADINYIIFLGTVIDQSLSGLTHEKYSPWTVNRARLVPEENRNCGSESMENDVIPMNFTSSSTSPFNAHTRLSAILLECPGRHWREYE